MPVFAVILLSFGFAYATLRLLVGRFRNVALDRPNPRSLHERPVPRTGGIAVLIGAGVSAPFAAGDLWLPLISALCLALMSFVDDLRGLHTAVRLSAHIAAAALLTWYALWPIHPVKLVLLAFTTAWITNLYNFMDGSDGLAAGMTVLGFATYGFASFTAAHIPLAMISFAIAASALAFLIYNFHPARIFLGDVGSIPLGFLAASLGILGWRDDIWPIWFPALVFAPFIGDASLTLLKRFFRGQPVWRPHRDHYYQRMVRMGLGHRQTAYVAYVLMTLCSLAALIGRAQAPGTQAMTFIATVAFLAGIAIWVDIRWARFARS